MLTDGADTIAEPNVTTEMPFSKEVTGRRSSIRQPNHPFVSHSPSNSAPANPLPWRIHHKHQNARVLQKCHLTSHLPATPTPLRNITAICPNNNHTSAPRPLEHLQKRPSPIKARRLRRRGAMCAQSRIPLCIKIWSRSRERPSRNHGQAAHPSRPKAPRLSIFTSRMPQTMFSPGPWAGESTGPDGPPYG